MGDKAGSADESYTILFRFHFKSSAEALDVFGWGNITIRAMGLESVSGCWA